MVGDAGFGTKMETEEPKVVDADKILASRRTADPLWADAAMRGACALPRM
jgi:hypothetical protein